MKAFIFLTLLFIINSPVFSQSPNQGLVLPEKLEDLKHGEISSQKLLSEPLLILVANRNSFELIEKTSEVGDYPANTIWIPNVAAAPGLILSLFIKPALKKTAEKVSPRVIYDPDGEVIEALKVISEDEDYLAVFYADSDSQGGQSVKKIMEKIISAKQYQTREQKQKLVEEIVAQWKIHHR